MHPQDTLRLLCSRVGLGAGNVEFGASNVEFGASNVVFGASNVGFGAGDVGFRAGNVGFRAGNVGFGVSFANNAVRRSEMWGSWPPSPPTLIQYVWGKLSMATLTTFDALKGRPVLIVKYCRISRIALTPNIMWNMRNCAQ